jgi:hypothetical protein
MLSPDLIAARQVRPLILSRDKTKEMAFSVVYLEAMAPMKDIRQGVL